jgi:hypothetical protein
MSKYEKQGQSKIINSYGAVGTLIQTMKNGSLKIEDFDEWPYYRTLYNQYRTQTDTGYLLNPEFIKDDRLVQKLQDLSPSIIGIFSMPENEEKFGTIDHRRPNNLISASLFPEWFFCPSCGTMKHHSQLIVGQNHQMPRHCNMFMEQFSFVLISESGEIADIPWKEYLTNDGNKISFNAIAPDNTLVLKYSTGGSAEFLETKTVTATIDGRTITKSLGPLASKVFTDGITTYKMAIRQGNNLCFVQTWTSLYVPKYVIPANERDRIKDLNEDGKTSAEILQKLNDRNPNTLTTIEHIESFLNPIRTDDKDDLYKWEEFDFIVNQLGGTYTDESIEFDRHAYNMYGIKNIHRVNKLKVTHVQTGYSRLKPVGTSKKIFTNPNVVYYPGVEMQGEGMLLEFDVNKLNTYINNPTKNSNTVEINNMMHSLSHCIMKELEFECGYPLNSLKERMYFGTEQVNGTEQVKYAGVLIYSATGTNSSFGGIATLFEDNLRKLNILFDNAIMRATDCPNDPICIEEEKHGNKGVCYSCNLIPETSCENFNSGLDRASLIDFTNTINP